MTTQLPVPPPIVSPETAPYWAATAEGKLSIPYCKVCGNAVYYPRAHCYTCYSDDLEWRELSGRGTVYTFTIVRRGEGPYAEVTPYVVAYVTLDEGPVVLSNVIEIDPEAVEIGMAVEAVFVDTGEGNALVRWKPAS
jgi:uncharacterized protein